MDKKYDAIVVGAGVGGLTAAAFMGRAGKKVLVLEQNPHPGGTAWLYSRKGYNFPMGPLGFSSPSIIKGALDGLGHGDGFELKRVRYQARAYDMDVPFSLDFPGLEKEYTRLFPEEADSVKKFMSDMERIGRAVRDQRNEEDERTAEEAADTPASEYMDGLFSDWRIKRFLGSIGTWEPYSSVALLASMWTLMANEGIWFPLEGLAGLTNRLKKAAESFGAEVMLSSPVEKILVEDGAVSGVRLRSGELVEAEAVISNADFKKTFLSLVDAEHLPENLVRDVKEARQTESNLQVSIGIKAEAADLSAFDRGSRILYRRSGKDAPAPDWEAPEIDPDVLCARQLEVTLWSNDDPALAPPGGGVLVIRSEAEYSHFVRYRPAWAKRSPEYMPYKMKLAKALVAEADNVAPGLSDAIDFLDVATPLTFEERGGRTGGAVAGWSWDFGDGVDSSSKELVITPVKGLYMAGYQAFSSLFMGGVPTAVESGGRAARAAMDGEGPVDNMDIPGGKR